MFLVFLCTETQGTMQQNNNNAALTAIHLLCYHDVYSNSYQQYWSCIFQLLLQQYVGVSSTGLSIPRKWRRKSLRYTGFLLLFLSTSSSKHLPVKHADLCQCSAAAALENQHALEVNCICQEDLYLKETREKEIILIPPSKKMNKQTPPLAHKLSLPPQTPKTLSSPAIHMLE